VAHGLVASASVSGSLKSFKNCKQLDFPFPVLKLKFAVKFFQSTTSSDKVVHTCLWKANMKTVSK